MGLIVTWASPFMLLLWSLAYQFILGLPLINTVFPILLPTLYLWHVDTVALERGTWVIQAGTKLGVQLWKGLDIEEALFFLVTNTLVVFGLLAFDNAVAVLDSFPNHFPTVPALPSPALLVQSLLFPTTEYDRERIIGLQDAAKRLKAKSRSFYLASSTFSGRMRIDLILLYNWCRVADDLVDNADSPVEALNAIGVLEDILEAHFIGRPSDRSKVIGYIVKVKKQCPQFVCFEFYDRMHGLQFQLEHGTGSFEDQIDFVQKRLPFLFSPVPALVADLEQLRPEFEALRWVSEHAVPQSNLSPEATPTLMSTKGYGTLLKEKDRYLRDLAFQFPPGTREALLHLPSDHISSIPLEEMLMGFKMDLAFSDYQIEDIAWPFGTERDLENYAFRVAGTVAELCLELVFHHTRSSISPDERDRIIYAGTRMGIALQYVNIARDIAVDAKMNRVYLPELTLLQDDLTADDVIKNPDRPEVRRIRSRLLDKAFKEYEEVRGVLEQLPREVRGPMRVAIESYMEIGRVIREENHPIKADRATVPTLRRIKVALKALHFALGIVL